MDYFSYAFALSLLQIIWIDLLMSGDNAVVIALACRSLPPQKQKIGIALGAATAIGLRIIFAIIITYLLAIPYLKIAGGMMLTWIAINLVRSSDEDDPQIKSRTSLWGAVGTIAVADMVMSLDNVVAVAGASHGHIPLFVIGLAISIPFVIAGASLITALIERLPILVWAGGALLGWIAGEMIVTDPFVAAFVHNFGDTAHYAAALLGALLVLLIGYLWSKFESPETKTEQVSGEPVS